MGDDTIHGAYQEGRERLTAWAGTLDPDAAATLVPALPGWTVKDTFSHLAGLAADVISGGMSGPPDDAATARQVAERADRSLEEVVAEWGEVGPRLESLLGDLGRAAPIQVAIDVWAHEVDVRSAVGSPIPDGGAAARFLRRAIRRGVGRDWQERGVPPLRIVTEDDEWVAGGDEPAGTLTISWFELGRVQLGRRSRSQMAALDWDGAEPAPWIAALPVFGPAEVDVVDASPA
jgi:uncharacterized protein (TIGR03083 family)